MKKFLSLLIVSVLLTGLLSGCGAGSSAVSGGSGSGGGFVILVDGDAAPYSYTDDKGKVCGIVPDLLKCISKEQDFKYELKALSSEEAEEALKAGEADAMMLPVAITQQRKEIFDFGSTYYTNMSCCAVSEKSKIKGISQIKDMTVAVKSSTMSAKWAKSLAAENNLEIKEFDSFEKAYNSVISGKADACFGEYARIAYQIKNGEKLRIIEKNLSEYFVYYALAVKSAEYEELVAAYNLGLETVKSNGQYDEVINRYLEV